MSSLIYYRHFDTAETFMNFFVPWSGQDAEIDLKRYVFRGQRNAEYSLIPSALRPENLKAMRQKMNIFIETSPELSEHSSILAMVEFQLIRDFYRDSDMHGLLVPSSKTLRNALYNIQDISSLLNFNSTWLPDDMLESAALAQHYGVPTRLLDWSYNSFVASFFATLPKLDGSEQGFTNDGDLCIWGINRDAVAQMHYAHDLSKSQPMNIDFPEFPLKFVTPHYEGNPNLAAQQGLFTHWSTTPGNVLSLVPENPPVKQQIIGLEQQIAEFNELINFKGVDNTLLKITLSNRESEKVAKYVRELGYTPAKLFPGYEGVTRSINERVHFTRTRKDSRF